MKIVLEFNDLTVRVESEGLTPSIDAIMIAAAALAESQKLGYGKPILTMDATVIADHELSKVRKTDKTVI